MGTPDSRVCVWVGGGDAGGGGGSEFLPATQARTIF